MKDIYERTNGMEVINANEKIINMRLTISVPQNHFGTSLKKICLVYFRVNTSSKEALWG